MKARSDYHHSAPILSFLKISLPLILLMVATSSRDAWAVSINLVPLLDNAEITVNLNPAETYSLSAEYPLTKSKTINGNGATLTLGGPIHASGGNVSSSLNNVKITCTGVGSGCRRNGGTRSLCRIISAISCVGAGTSEEVPLC